MKPIYLSQPESNIPASHRLSKQHYRLGVVLLLLAYLVLQISLMPTLILTYDEGLHLQVSRLRAQGYEPYSQVFTLANPLFVWFSGGLGRLGLTTEGFRFVFLSFGLLLLLSTTSLTRALLGEQVALVTLFLLGTAVTFLAEATAVLAVIPALSLAVLSLRWLLHDQNHGQNRKPAGKPPLWVLASGIGWGMALWISFSVFPIGLIALLSCLLSIVYCRFWIMGVLITLVLGLFLAGPEIVFSYLLKNQVTIRQNLSLIQADNFQVIGQFLVFNIFVSLLAVYGVARIYDQAKHTLWFIFIWGLLSFCWLMLQVPLPPGDVAILLPPLAIIAGWSVVDIKERLGSKGPSPTVSAPGWLKVGLVGGVLGFYLLLTWQQLNGFIFQDIDTENDLIQFQERAEMADFIREQTAPTDCVISDDPTLAIQADRFPSPPLVNLSRERVEGGLISEAEIQALAQEANCRLVVFYRRPYHRHLPNFRDWAETYFANEQGFQNTDILFN